MVKEMIAKGYIQNFAHENIAYLDSLNKATKPGGFNVQDGAAIRGLTAMMDPDKWEEVFPLELVRTYRNIDGDPISVTHRNDDGTERKVYANETDENGNYVMTDEELMNRVKEKYIYPVAHKVVMMMSRQTPNTTDNQKAGTIADWKKLKEVFDEKWGEGKTVEEDPYKQSGDMRGITRDIQQKLYTVDENGRRIQINHGRRNSRGTDNAAPRAHVNHHVVVEEMHINSNNDADEFARSFVEYCDSYPELARAKRDFMERVADRGYLVTEQELYDFAVELLDSYTNLD